MKRGIRVTTKGTEYVLVISPSALLAGLANAKRTYRQRNLCCSFSRQLLSEGVWTELQNKARAIGDILVDGPYTGMVFDHRWQ